MKRRQLLLTLFGLPVVGSLIYATIAKSKNNGEPYDPVLAKSPTSTPTATPEKPTFTEPTEEPLLRFAAIADAGFGSKDQYAVASAMQQTYEKKPFPFVLMAGDNIYSYGEISLAKPRFEDPYAPLLSKDVKFYAVLGNHDIIKSNNGLDQINYPLFNMSDRYYSFNKGDTDKGTVEFFALDTNSNTAWDDQLAWLDQQLTISTASWKIVFGHHPLYSSGRHGSNPELAKKLAPIFAKHKVPLYLCGHDHGYERFEPINGTTYIVNGGGGAPLYKFGKSTKTAFVSSQFSFMTFDVYQDQIITKAIATDGKVFDQSVIMKIRGV
jgi:3',5'-cyclic AMP phosphodiesterase CpdA